MPDLIGACFLGNLNEVKRLVRDNVDINITDSDGYTALMWTLRLRHWSISEYLLSQPSIDTDIKSNSRMTALHEACHHGASTEIVRKIVTMSSHQTINSRDSGIPPIMWAVIEGHNDLVTLLARMDVVDWDKEELVRVAR